MSLQYNNVLHIKLFHTYICEINKQLAPNGQSNTRARVCPNSFPFSKWSYQTKIHNMTLYTKLINHETGTIFSLSLSAFHIFEQKCNLREYKFNTFLKREKKTIKQDFTDKTYMCRITMYLKSNKNNILKINHCWLF